MNLKTANGMVPVRTDNPLSPWALVPFPDKEGFTAVFARGKRGPRIDIERYWTVLTKRSGGATLLEAGKAAGITRERVRQMEAKFLRLIELSLRTD